VARSLDVLSRSLSMCFLSPLYIFSDYDIIYVSYIYLIVLPRFDSIYDNLYDIPIFQQSTEPSLPYSVPNSMETLSCVILLIVNLAQP